MRQPPHPGASSQQQQHPTHPSSTQIPPYLSGLSVGQLQSMAQRQQAQIDSQQQLLVAKEQRLKYLRGKDYKQYQMASEYERLRRLREKVEAQELKLRKLRALRGQQQQQQQHPHQQHVLQQQQHHNANANAAVLADLDSIRSVFAEKEKELSLAVRKVDELTRQLEELRSGRMGPMNSNGVYPPQVVELERLRRELAYRKQLNEQQNAMISQQRAQLSMGQDEMQKIDARIVELQDRVARKRLSNQQLASQISAATSAKQAQLRAIMAAGGVGQATTPGGGIKPVSTVEPFQRQEQPPVVTEAGTNKNFAGGPPMPSDDPKYQTLPFGTKFNQQQQQQHHQSKSLKIEQLKAEKDNNNVKFADDLPPPPPSTGPPRSNNGRPVTNSTSSLPDHQGNYNTSSSSGMAPTVAAKPVSTVAPNFVSSSGPTLQRPTELFPPPSSPGDSTAFMGNLHQQHAHLAPPQSQSTPIAGNGEENGKPRPALPPKPLGGKQPPPYIPAPAPDANHKPSNNNSHSSSDHSLDDSSITIRGGSGDAHKEYQHNLSVAHPEEGTSVDDDMPHADGGSEADGKGGVYNHNLHMSINRQRRIEMPPAFHFPEDGTPPSDLIGSGGEEEQASSGQGPTMMNRMFSEFEHLSVEQQQQLIKKSLEEEEYLAQQVPEIVTNPEPEGQPKRKMPPGIVKTTNLKGKADSKGHSRHVCFDPLALLLDASLEGELDLVRQTAALVTDPSAANDEGITALHNAICAGHFDIVRFLVQFGCDVNAQDSDGWTPLHCAASCNNLPMVRFLVEHGACVFAATFSDAETAAEKCEQDEEGFAGCSEYLYSIQEKLGGVDGGLVYAVYDYDAERSDELEFLSGNALKVLRKGDDNEIDWWWARTDNAAAKEGYIPKNLLGLFPRVSPKSGGHSPEESDRDTASMASEEAGAPSSSEEGEARREEATAAPPSSSSQPLERSASSSSA